MFPVIFAIALFAVLAITLIDGIVEEVNESTIDRMVNTYTKLIKRRKAKNFA